MAGGITSRAVEWRPEVRREAALKATPSEDITTLLKRIDEGDHAATKALLALVYDELRALARRQMAGERVEATLEPTALVHEAYMRLFGGKPLRCADRRAFYAAAAETMRRVLIDMARSRGRLKRGGRRYRARLSGIEIISDADGEQVLEIDDAITALEQHEPDVAAVMRLRVYGGLSAAETAETLGVSERTVYRDWLYGRAWLARELGHGG
jgi:RNA polymerase sigma factor (TIGR02999 family)